MAETGTQTLTYAASGVDYDPMDRFKRAAQARAKATARNCERFGVWPIEGTRGESAYLLRLSPEPGKKTIAHVDEGLGTKNLVADALAKLTGRNYYLGAARDTVAMAVNDMITIGALPLMCSMHIDVGHSDWFRNEERASALVNGWGEACDDAGCIWSCGESATLKDIIYPEAASLSCSAVGQLNEEHSLSPNRIQKGDAIVFFESNGIHANGLTLARTIAGRLSKGYETPVGDTTRTFGAMLLEPTHIYVKLLEYCFVNDIRIHYAVNITGHGWRKLMRAPQAFAYIVRFLPRPQPLFEFIQKHGPLSDHEAYATLNMGAGFALYMSECEAKKLVKRLEGNPGMFPYRVYIAGHVEASTERCVVIPPKALRYTADDLQVR